MELIYYLITPKNLERYFKKSYVLQPNCLHFSESCCILKRSHSVWLEDEQYASVESINNTEY